MNEQTSRDPGAQAEHEAKLAQVSNNLKSLAEALLAQHPQFPPADFGRAFCAVGLALVLGGAGAAVTAAWLRDMAETIEADKAPSH